MHERVMEPGALHAVPRGVWVIDSRLPILAFVSEADLSVRIIGDWFAESASAGLNVRSPVCNALAADDTSCWVAPTGVSAVLRFSGGIRDRFALPDPATQLAVARGTCWAVLDVGDRCDTRLSRITEHETRSFTTDYQLYSLITAGGGEVFALGKPPEGTCGNNGSDLVLRLDDDGCTEMITLTGRDAQNLRLHAGRSGVWLESGALGLGDSDGHLMESLERSSAGWQWGQPVAMPLFSSLLVDSDDTAWVWVRTDDRVREINHRFVVERRDLRGSGSTGAIVVPGLPASRSARGGRAWMVCNLQPPLPAEAPQHLLLRLTAEPDGRIEAHTVAEWPDCTSALPRPQPPVGLEPCSWAEARRAGMEAELAAEWENAETGVKEPFLAGVIVESVSLEGSFPDTECVIRFQAEANPDIKFGRRLRFFDETGSPIWEEFAAVHLKEDIDSGAMLPLSQDLPVSGIVWI